MDLEMFKQNYFILKYCLNGDKLLFFTDFVILFVVGKGNILENYSNIFLIVFWMWYSKKSKQYFFINKSNRYF